MKRIISLALVMLFVLSMAACGSQPAEPAATEAPAATPAPAPEATAEPTPEPAPTEPVWEPGISRAGYGELEYKQFMRGDVVKVIGQWKDYFVVEGEEVDLIIEKRFVRFDSEGPYESWEGYTRENTEVFDNGYLEGEPIATFGLNERVTVVDGNKGWYYIEWEGGSGYVDEVDISETMIVYYYGGGGGGGGVSGDINLGLVAYFGPKADALEEPAYVQADKIRGSLCVTVRGETLKVTSYDDEVCNIYLEGFEAKVPRWLLHMEGDEEYEAWTGYTKYMTAAFEEYQMRNELDVKYSVNDEVKVVDELPMCYVIELEDGQFAYVDLEQISETVIVDYGGGGGGGGGDIWTAPLV